MSYIGETNKTATRRMHAFMFNDDKHHVALVDKAANKAEIVVMKSLNNGNNMKTFEEIKKSLKTANQQFGAATSLKEEEVAKAAQVAAQKELDAFNTSEVTKDAVAEKPAEAPKEGEVTKAATDEKPADAPKEGEVTKVTVEKAADAPKEGEVTKSDSLSEIEVAKAAALSEIEVAKADITRQLAEIETQKAEVELVKYTEVAKSYERTSTSEVSVLAPILMEISKKVGVEAYEVIKAQLDNAENLLSNKDVLKSLGSSEGTEAGTSVQARLETITKSLTDEGMTKSEAKVQAWAVIRKESPEALKA